MNELQTATKFVYQFVERLPAQTKTMKLLKAKYTNENELIVQMIALAYKTFYVDLKTLFNANLTLVQMHTILVESQRVHSFGFFIADVCKDVSINWHHIEWLDLINNPKHLCLAASRGLGKTFFFTELYSCWLAYRYNSLSTYKPFTFDSVLIYSNNQKMANKKLVKIKKRIETNPILRERLYKRLKWASEEIVTSNGFTITTLGFDTASRGFHVYNIICDDILKKNAMYSQSYREMFNDTFYAEIMPMINEGGKLINIGTPMHNEDLIGDIKGKIKNNSTVRNSFEYREYPAIMPNGRYIWVKQLSEKTLSSQRALCGELVFAQEFLCKPMSDSSSIFPYKYLNLSKDDSYSYCTSSSGIPQHLLVQLDYVVTGSDFAKSGAASADDSVHIVFGVANNKHIYCLNIIIKRGLGYNEQMGILKMLDYDFNPDCIGLENNGFQSLFEEGIQEYLPYATIKGFTTTASTKNKKEFGLQSLSVLFERALLHFPYATEKDRKLTDLILAQFNSISFTEKGLKAVSGHDDIPMACWVAKQSIFYVDKNYGAVII